MIMDELSERTKGIEPESNKPVEGVKRSQLSAIESLAFLLLREIESLKQIEEKRSLGDGKALNFNDEMQKFEATLIRNALLHTNGVQYKAAQLLGLKPSTLNEKIKRQKIDLSKFEKSE
ncbi:MAG: hypothetical protein KIS76_15225 [Pyrinomonadaceae bacterium]|nr:hypothetical protein [Pyrinomonadaceae bacterium]